MSDIKVVEQEARAQSPVAEASATQMYASQLKANGHPEIAAYISRTETLLLQNQETNQILAGELVGLRAQINRHSAMVRLLWEKIQVLEAITGITRGADEAAIPSKEKLEIDKYKIEEAIQNDAAEEAAEEAQRAAGGEMEDELVFIQ